MLDYIVYFYCHEIGLAIEIDGSSHDEKFLYDANRQNRLEKEGVHFLRFSDKEVLNVRSNVITEIKEKIREANE